MLDHCTLQENTAFHKSLCAVHYLLDTSRNLDSPVSNFVNVGITVYGCTVCLFASQVDLFW